VKLEKPPRDGLQKQELTINVTVKPAENFESEDWALNEKKWLFEDLFQVKVNLCVDIARAQPTPTS
jgi:hypothetical protein